MSNGEITAELFGYAFVLMALVGLAAFAWRQSGRN